MKIKPTNFIPLAIAGAAILISCLVHQAARRSFAKAPDAILAFPEYVEALTYDARMRLSASLRSTNQWATNLAALFFDEKAFDLMNRGEYAELLAPVTNSVQRENPLFNLKWPWPRYVHGQIVRELTAQGAVGIGFDITFSDEIPDAKIPLPDGELISSDDFLALQVQKASNVVLATEGSSLPMPKIGAGAYALGSIASKPDYGVLRRVQAFTNEVRVWHSGIAALRKPLNLLLDEVTIKTNKIIIRSAAMDDQAEPPPTVIPLNAKGEMAVNPHGDVVTEGNEKEPGYTEVKPFELRRVWNLGIVLAAKALKLDLDKAEIGPDRIILHGPGGLVRTIPVDSQGFFYIDWSIRFDNDLTRNHTPVYYGGILPILYDDFGRVNGKKQEELDHPYFKDRLVVIGSVATGNNITDIGPTPLQQRTPLVTKHLNVANSLMTGHFIQRASISMEFFVLALLGLAAGLVCWRGQVLTSLVSLTLLSVGYVLIATYLYVHSLYWIPIFMALAGGLLFPASAVLSYRVGFEEREKRRVKGIFSRMVSPDVVQELLDTEKLELGGARRNITIFFADVRGFTQFTESKQRAAEDYIKEKGLKGAAADSVYDAQAKETLETVNRYLATIADLVIKHGGTLDKYIGDCVMAFWGAPIFQEQHAVNCVRCAVEAQRALYRLNQERAIENERRTLENMQRQASGKELLPTLTPLYLGTGINSGFAVAGLMGSQKFQISYTVFGREVNLASRLEGVSGIGRIIIGQGTYNDLQRYDSELASTVVALDPVSVKGFPGKVPIFEVPWRTPDMAPAAEAEQAPVEVTGIFVKR